MRKRKYLPGNRLLTVCCALALTVPAGALGIQAADTAVDEGRAQEIALADAGLTEEDTQRIHTRYEREDREDVISVEFVCDRMEYEYMIRESDGMILEWSIEGTDVGSAEAEVSLSAGSAGSSQDSAADDQQTGDSSGAGSTGDTLIAVDGGELIGIEAAKEIVLQDSGAAPEDAMFTKIKFEYQGRYYNYEIEMREGRSEFEYTLDAETGDIIESENDWDD